MGLGATLSDDEDAARKSFKVKNFITPFQNAFTQLEKVSSSAFIYSFCMNECFSEHCYQRKGAMIIYVATCTERESWPLC